MTNKDSQVVEEASGSIRPDAPAFLRRKRRALAKESDVNVELAGNKALLFHVPAHYVALDFIEDDPDLVEGQHHASG
ncbi:MAG: hypothetical protein WCQ50_22095, partial [Spirochaetota bacterium]